MGIDLEKMWVATVDERTRDSHIMLDGEVVDVDSRFSNGLIGPGDQSTGDPAEYINCRCTTVSVIDGMRYDNAERFTRMDYEEWKQGARDRMERRRMKVEYEFNIQTDMTDYAINQCKEKINRAMEKIGQRAVGYSKFMCPVDTGRLRSSITHAVGTNEVMIGTNVEYAIYVELGARGRRPIPFIRDSIANHISEYQGIFDSELKS